MRQQEQNEGLKAATHLRLDTGMNYLSASMASSPTASTETAVLDLLGLREHCTQSLSEDIVRRIHAIRALCKAAEASEGNGTISWRRGGGGGGHSSSNSSNTRSSALPNRWRGQQTSTHRGAPAPGDKPSGRYVSKYTNSDTPVEDKILNQVILNKLNKFSAANYNEIRDFLEQILDSDEKEFLRDFMLLVFKKASTEPTFCSLYARMISELSMKYTSLKTELDELYTRYLTIFEEVSEEQTKSYEEFVQRNREKLQRLGYSQFLGELTSYGILELTQLQELYTKILKEISHHASQGETKQMLVEEYIDCLVRMTKAFQKGNRPELVTIRKSLGQGCEPLMEELLSNRSTKYPGLSKKGSFSIMDCLDIFRSSGSS